MEKVYRNITSKDVTNFYKTIKKIQNMGSDNSIPYIISSLLIEMGTTIGDEKITKDGIDTLLNNLDDLLKDKKYVSGAYYNLANGYFNLFIIKSIKNPNYILFNNTELDKVKIYLRKALNSEIKDLSLLTDIFGNLGNCFDYLGRSIDALECYDKALNIDPNHGMAVGNKGIALFSYSKLMHNREIMFLIEAYHLLLEGIELGVYPEAENTFRIYIDKIKKQIPQKNLEKPLKHSEINIITENDFEKFLIEFCLKHRLYLNLCNFCQRCDLAMGDPIAIKMMIIKTKDNESHPRTDPYLRSSAYLNQIKQDYITARFLLITSRYKKLNLTFVDKNVKIIDTLDYSMHNIYIELMKTSFTIFYNILDKIAYFINDYVKLNIKPESVNFRRIWYTNYKNKIINKKIKNTENLSLNALFDLHRDFESGPYCNLRKTRNALTHRFIHIKVFQGQEDAENMLENTFFNLTLELAQLVRNAIMYLLHFVYIEEKKKEIKLNKKLPSLEALELPDELKNPDL